MATTRTTSPLAAAWRRQQTLAAPAERPGPDAPLTDTERDILAFEAGVWARGGEKMIAIRERFGWSETRYYQVLRSLLDRRAAVEHAPAVVLRLRRQLEASRRATR